MEISAHRNCCGVTHISSFGYDPNARHGTDAAGNNQTFLQKLDEILGGRDRRRTYEIVLNGRQNDAWGQLIIDRGGVKVAEAVNSIHNSRIHTYFFNDDLTLYGNRPQPAVQVAVPVGAPDANGNYPNYARLSRVPVGTRVQMNHVNSPNNGKIGTITAAPRNAENEIYGVRYDDGTQVPNTVITGLRPAPVAAAPVEGWTHVYLDPTGRNNRFHNRLCRITRPAGPNMANAQVFFEELGLEICAQARLVPLQQIVRERVAPPAPRQEAIPVRQERREILNEVFAVRRVDGLRGPFPGLLEAREAYPRVRRFDRRVIFNDGTIENQENIDA